ncbi:flagellar hook-length control protein FliK [Vibrio furnissii]|uniref:flagellar hook-length control protein FliK n=1 Tax=Vibrio furnissii TaxID=29494 RepID=UPI001EEC2F08|nr:flagellar hook-length control protein FliK [Vibrio furnissii]MCG6266341.1 flagellar hook-length control protein FliK [Vibrio furnissii]
MNASITLSKFNPTDAKTSVSATIAPGFQAAASELSADRFQPLIDTVSTSDIADQATPETVTERLASPTMPDSVRQDSVQNLALSTTVQPSSAQSTSEALGPESIRVLSPLETQAASVSHTRASAMPMVMVAGAEVRAAESSAPMVEMSTLLQTAAPTEIKDAARGWVFKAAVDKHLTAEQMGQKLSALVADKVAVQYNAKASAATIRLDPPDLGKIDLLVRVDGGKVQIQVQASSHMTRESLQLTSDRLRDELLNQNFIDVDVHIFDEHTQHDPHQELNSNNDLIVASNLVSEEQEKADVTQTLSELARI